MATLVLSSAQRVGRILGVNPADAVTEKALEAALRVAEGLAGERWRLTELALEEPGFLDLQPSLNDGPSVETVTTFTDALHEELKRTHPGIAFVCLVKEREGPDCETESLVNNTIYFTRVMLAEIQ